MNLSQVEMWCKVKTLHCIFLIDISNIQMELQQMEENTKLAKEFADNNTNELEEYLDKLRPYLNPNLTQSTLDQLEEMTKETFLNSMKRTLEYAEETVKEQMKDFGASIMKELLKKDDLI